MDSLEILVLSQGLHSMPSEDYAEALRDRLADVSIHHAQTKSQERAMIGTTSVATGLSIDESLLANADSLELFGCVFAGTDHLPMESLRAQEVIVTNGSGVHGPNIAEYVLGSIIALTHRFDIGRQRQRRREWRHYVTNEVYKDTVTIIGLGAIGTAITSRLEALDVNTIGIRYTPSKGGPTDEVIGMDDPTAFEDALARTDHLILACPLTPETKGLIGRNELSTLPHDATLVNISRGPVVKTDALVWAIRENRLRGAALDVTDPEPLPEDHPLWTFSNVLISPHNAGSTPAYYDRIADIVAENVERLRTGEPLINVVD